MNNQEDNYGVRPTLCEDGKYRWAYEVHLLKNPSMFYDLMKVFALSFGFVFALMFVVELFEGNLDAEALKTLGIVIVGISAFMFVICVIGYLIWAGMSGWRYVALFEMDETGVTHIQTNKHVKRAEVVSDIGILAGILSGRPGLVGTSLLAATVNRWTSNYSSVRRVIMVRRRNLIKVNELLTKNRVYAQREDLDFVADYIRQRCPRLKQ